MATTKVKLDGPIFGPGAVEAAKAFTDSLTAEVALIGQTWIKLDTERMTRSGRETGAAAEGVKVAGAGSKWVISGGVRKGEFSWPWLEGTSKRNQSTGFKGYKSFRRTRLRMRKTVGVYAQEMWTLYAGRFGGTP